MKYDYRELEKFFTPNGKAQQDVEFQADDALQDEVTFYEDFSKVVNWSASMKEAHAELQADLSPTATVRTMGVRRLLSLAASVLVLLSCGTFWHANNSYTNQALSSLKENKLNLYDASALRAIEAQETSTLQAVTIALEAEDFAEARSLVQAVSEDEPADVLLLKSYIAHQLQDFGEAARIAKKVLGQKNTKLTSQKAEWLLVQAKLAQSEEGSELNALVKKIVADDTHLFQKEATKLENQLNSFWRRFLL